jgi:hypothetical protein
MADKKNSKNITRRCFLKKTSITLMSVPYIMGACNTGEVKAVEPCPSEVKPPQCPEDIRIGSGDYLRIGHMCGNIF